LISKSGIEIFSPILYTLNHEASIQFQHRKYKGSVREMQGKTISICGIWSSQKEFNRREKVFWCNHDLLDKNTASCTTFNICSQKIKQHPATSTGCCLFLG
jgi:hypothetical protein